jgi:hypothetical protein
VTLVEVIAATALLTSGLIGVMLGFSRSVRNLEESRLRIAALAEADKLLFKWVSEDKWFPRRKQGIIAKSSWVWSTRDVRTEPKLRLDVVELRVSLAEKPEEALASLELVLPSQAKPQRSTAVGGSDATSRVYRR